MDKKMMAKQGRNGDSQLGHLTPGEMVIPKQALTPQLRGLLNTLLTSSGQEAPRFTVGPNASKNPKTGLLEFWGDDGGDSGNGGGESQGGRGRDGFSAKGGVSNADGVGRGGNGGADQGNAESVGNSMMGMNSDPLGYGRYTGETVAGTLSNMADQMREAGYKARSVSDTMSNMGVGYGTRAGLLGFGPALGTFGFNALNTGGRLLGGLAGGLPGAMLGGLLGAAVTGDANDVGNQFGRNVVGTLASGISSAAGLGPLGGALASKLADRAFNSMTANAGPAQNTAKTAGNADLAGLSGYNNPMGMNQPAAMVTPEALAMQFSPVQLAELYDPMQKLRARGLS
jgi:hypothetical protein